MNIKILMAMGAILLVTQVFSVAASSGVMNENIKLAAHDTPRVELYITDWCPYCRMAMKFFQSKGIPFVAYDIEKDRDAARRKNELDRQRGVPFAVINGKLVHGFSEDAYQRALDSN